IWLRFVLVPGLTDDLREIEQIAKFAAGLGNVQRVDVLPFHQMGLFKWKELALNYTLEQMNPPTNELVNSVCAQFRAEGLKAYRSSNIDPPAAACNKSTVARESWNDSSKREEHDYEFQTESASRTCSTAGACRSSILRCTGKEAQPCHPRHRRHNCRSGGN